MYEFLLNRNYKKVHVFEDSLNEYVSIKTSADSGQFDNFRLAGKISKDEAIALRNEEAGIITEFWGSPCYRKKGEERYNYTESGRLQVLLKERRAYIIFDDNQPWLQ